MQDEIIFERMKLSDREKVLAFLQVAFAETPRQSDPQFWNWHYLDNPNSRSSEIPVWLAKCGERIVGQLATIPVELNLGTEVVPAIWLADLIVDPEFRRKGIAKKLVLTAQDFCPFMLAVPTDRQHTPALFQSLGWVIVGKIPRFQKILFPGEALRELAGVRPLRAVVNVAYAPFRPSIKTLSRGEQYLEFRDEFDPSFDDLWREAKEQWGCSVSRSSEMLDWQFCKQPNKKFDILAYYDGSKLLGYAVLFFRRAGRNGSVDKAAISDICYHPGRAKEVVDALLRGALKLSIERRAGSLVADTLDTLLAKRLGNLGFWRVKSSLQLMAIGPRHQKLLYDSDKWLLTRGDSDISIFEAQNI